MKNAIINIVLIIITLFISFYELPYYIDAPGGLDNLNNKVKVEQSYDAKGSINLTYVRELKATLPLMVVAYFHPDWEIHSKKDANIGTLDYQSMMKREQILMKQSYTSAIKYAYEKANKTVDVKQEKCYVIYTLTEAKTDLKVGDRILYIDDNKIQKCSDILEYVKSKNVSDKSKIRVENSNKEYVKNVEYQYFYGTIGIGIQVGTEYELETLPKYQFKFNENEYGPSGGLMIALAVYNSLVEKDITGGKKIAGTGTLEPDGSVGEIGGIEFKLKGAVKNKADVFLAPSGENYETAVELKQKRNYKIEIVEVKTFDDALNYLENNL